MRICGHVCCRSDLQEPVVTFRHACVCVTLGGCNRSSACSVFASTHMCDQERNPWSLLAGGRCHVRTRVCCRTKLLRYSRQSVVTCRLAVLVCDRQRTHVYVEAGNPWSRFRLQCLLVCLRTCSCCREARNLRARGSTREAYVFWGSPLCCRTREAKVTGLLAVLL